MNLTGNRMRLHDALPASGTGGITPRALADTTGLGYSTVTRLLRELHELGLAATDESGWYRVGDITAAASGHHEQADPEPGDEPDSSGEDQTATPNEPDGVGSGAEPTTAGTDGAEADGAGEVTAGRRMRKGELRELVLAALRDADGQPLGPAELSKRLHGRSQGAIANACDKLVADGLAVLTSEKPRRFAAVPTT